MCAILVPCDVGDLVKKSLLLAICLLVGSCQSENASGPPPPPVGIPGSLGRLGSTADAQATVGSGLLLMGGGPEVDEALRWMVAQAAGADFLVLRTSGGDAYNEYLWQMGGLNSVETLLLDTRTLAEDARVAEHIRKAEAIWLAGGDQAAYVRLWKGTRTEAALNYLLNEKKVLAGGTSAGCALLGGIYFDAARGTIRSEEALNNPFDIRVSLGKGDFIRHPLLAEVLIDMHYNNPDRRGRHLAFMARAQTQWQVVPKGIGVDEQTAVLLSAEGQVRVFGRGNAYFLRPTAPPETCQPGQPLTWWADGRALEVHQIAGEPQPRITFSFINWQPLADAKSTFWAVEQGTLRAGN